jgi:hypothetical protein
MNKNEQFATLPATSASYEGLIAITLDAGSDSKENHGWIRNS